MAFYRKRPTFATCFCIIAQMSVVSSAAVACSKTNSTFSKQIVVAVHTAIKLWRDIVSRTFWACSCKLFTADLAHFIDKKAVTKSTMQCLPHFCCLQGLCVIPCPGNRGNEGVRSANLIFLKRIEVGVSRASDWSKRNLFRTFHLSFYELFTAVLPHLFDGMASRKERCNIFPAFSVCSAFSCLQQW